MKAIGQCYDQRELSGAIRVAKGLFRLLESVEAVGSRKLLDLPTALLYPILKHVDMNTVKDLRIVCKGLNSAANAHISKISNQGCPVVTREKLESFPKALTGLSNLSLSIDVDDKDQLSLPISRRSASKGSRAASRS